MGLIGLLALVALLPVSVLLLTGCGEDKSTEPPKTANASEITVSIERIYSEQFQGRDVTLDLYLSNPDLSLCMKSFDLRIQYDGLALDYQSASLARSLHDLGWGWFSVAETQLDDSTTSLRISAQNADSLGSCRPVRFLNGVTEAIASLRFRVSSHWRFNCTFVPVYFVWQGCHDNEFPSLSSDTVNQVLDVLYWAGGDYVGPIIDEPGYSGPPDTCPSAPLSRHNIHFMNGGVSIICADSIGHHDIYGDIDLDGLPNTVDDILLFMDYFMYGDIMFSVDVDSQTIASDVNRDDEFLTVADYVYMFRILWGGAMPFPMMHHHEHTAAFIQQGELIAVNSDVSFSAVLLVFSGSAHPESLSDDILLKHDTVAGNLRLFICSRNLSAIPAGEHQILRLDRELELIEAQAATYSGEIMNVEF
jgi:hypothetical protein